MNNQQIYLISIIGLICVLIGVTLMQLISDAYPRLETFAPLIVISGFFVFLVSTALFIYATINYLESKKK